MDKIKFLEIEFPKLLHSLKPETKGAWGVLNAQQMVEHMSDSIRIANGRDKMQLHTSPAQVDLFKSFAMSDKAFKPNTKNALMGETPSAIRNISMLEAINEMENEMSLFINYFENNKGATLTNPFFGDLNYQEWTHLLHKHAVHHCTQFGLI